MTIFSLFKKKKNNSSPVTKNDNAETSSTETGEPVMNEENLGYTDNYQNKTAMTTPSNNEPGKNVKSIEGSITGNSNKPVVTEKKRLGQIDVTYHIDSETPSWVNDVNIGDKDLAGSSNVIIDNIEAYPNLKRSKELLDKLNMRDKHGDFKTECIKFQNELRSESEKIASMTESFIERVNKYMNDTNVL